VTVPVGLAGRPPGDFFFSPLADSYAAKGTSALVSADSGQDWFVVSTVAESYPTVIGGLLTNAAVAAAGRASYANANLGASVHRIGGRVVFSAAGPGMGVAALVVWKTLMPAAIASIPDSPLHLVVGPESWSVGVWESGSYVVLANAAFAVALANDGVTAHTIEAVISGTTATITLPDGNHVVTDARIASLAGPWACFETKQDDASSDTKAGFTEVWAST
jgi:hypothetical protein